MLPSPLIDGYEFQTASSTPQIDSSSSEGAVFVPLPLPPKHSKVFETPSFSINLESSPFNVSAPESEHHEMDSPISHSTNATSSTSSTTSTPINIIQKRKVSTELQPLQVKSPRSSGIMFLARDLERRSDPSLSNGEHAATGEATAVNAEIVTAIEINSSTTWKSEDANGGEPLEQNDATSKDSDEKQLLALASLELETFETLQRSDSEKHLNSALEFLDPNSPPSFAVLFDTTTDNLSNAQKLTRAGENAAVLGNFDEKAESAEINQRVSTTPAPLYQCSWSVATQQGYKYASSSNRTIRENIHPQMEDKFYPSTDDTGVHVHPITHRPFHLFLLADGHGSHTCSDHMSRHLPPLIVSLIGSREWNFPQDQDELSAQITSLFMRTDRDYCDAKLEEYRKWRSVLHSSSTTTGFTSKSRPVDDGCTLVVNILYEKTLVNCNVGDSRTLLLRRPRVAAPASSTVSHSPLNGFSPRSTVDSFSTVFFSKDHNPGHPQKARQIHENGGRFLMNGTHQFTQNLINSQGVERSCEYLSKCRIGRDESWRLSEIDYPACTTLNLTGTMGDLFFKAKPSLIDARPDITFCEMDVDAFEFILLMASDGLWDHMREQNDVAQNRLVSKLISTTMNSPIFCAPVAPSLSAPSNLADENVRKLSLIAHALCDREESMGRHGVYGLDFARYDDVTSFIVLIQ